MRVLTVSTNVLSVNYTDEQGQVSARFFILLEMVENQKRLLRMGVDSHLCFVSPLLLLLLLCYELTYGRLIASPPLLLQNYCALFSLHFSPDFSRLFLFRFIFQFVKLLSLVFLVEAFFLWGVTGV